MRYRRLALDAALLLKRSRQLPYRIKNTFQSLFGARKRR